MPAARVHAPFTLSETMTWPAASSSANSPVNRSPAATGFARVKVTLVWRGPGAFLAPWANVTGWTAGGGGVAGGWPGGWPGALGAAAVYGWVGEAGEPVSG